MNWKDILQPGQRIYCVLKHISRTGLNRTISFYAIKDDDLLNITEDAAQLLGKKLDNENHGVKFGGTGDHAERFVSLLATELFGDPRALKVHRLW